MPRKPCFHFLYRKCRYGDSCKFSHTMSAASDTTFFQEHNTRGYSRTGLLNIGSERDDISREPVAVPTFSLNALETQLRENSASGRICSGHCDTLVCFWPGRDRLEVLWKGFLTPLDPSNPWLVNSQTQALNFINSGLHALTKDNTATQFVRELGKTEGRGVLVIQELLDLSQHMEEANYVYAFVRTAHLQLFRLYLKHLNQIVDRHCIEDRTMSHESFKFKELIYEDTFQETMIKVDALTSKWIDECQGENSVLDSTLCFQTMRDEIKRLYKMLRRGERDMQVGAALRRAEQQTHGSEPEPWDMLEVGIPGRTVLKDGSVGPRHDNDRADIEDIQLLPTTEEYLSPEPLLLLETSHVTKMLTGCPLDQNAGLQDLYHRLVDNQGNLVAGRLRNANVDYNVYPIVEIAMPLKHTFSRGEHGGSRRSVERYGLCVDVRFQQPSVADMTRRAEPSEQQSRKQLWEKTGRLPFHEMVALVTYMNGELEVIFCQIVERDLERRVKDVVEVALQPFETQDFAILAQRRLLVSLKSNQERSHLRMLLLEFNRMRPQISQLIRMLFYPEVRDARETLEYPPILGVDKNVFFVNHNHPEDVASGVLGAPARSHSNEYEVAYVVSTLRYLLQQGYHTSDIAILTPYVGQLMKLRSALRGEFVLELNELDQVEIQRTFDDYGVGDDKDDGDEDDSIADGTWNENPAALGATMKELSGAIRAATIDNFQGEEATIILASLVRSSTNVHGAWSNWILENSKSDQRASFSSKARFDPRGSWRLATSKIAIMAAST
ncbi:unnamed protein product [Peronospora destructor]|uniref:C3H1-type domain-containing protein n=1 Tax=Peronospora destructor TaxID=86335 RepID=A0AAV0VIB6_9STRA|nr:unnamed protein product [Peronospora destructor]